MIRRLGIWYAKRTINVNVNILLAGLLALIPTLAIVRLVEHLLRSNVPGAARLALHHKAVISVSTFVADVFFDVSIYYALHWLANHSRKPQRQERLETIADAAIETVPFFKDATKVQFERMVLSPLLYILWLGTQFALMRFSHVSAVPATVAGWMLAIGVTRVLHTVWMQREERRQRAAAARAWAARMAGTPGGPPATNGAAAQARERAGGG